MLKFVAIEVINFNHEIKQNNSSVEIFNIAKHNESGKKNLTNKAT